METSGREKLCKFGKMNVIIIHQYFTEPNLRYAKVACVSYCKFANVFFAKL